MRHHLAKLADLPVNQPGQLGHAGRCGRPGQCGQDRHQRDPQRAPYAKSSNIVDAYKLKGRLLLLVGELDTNVDPASTLQVVGALQKAGKSFDFMPLVGTGHGAAETAYGSRLRMEFLVRHLLDDAPAPPTEAVSIQDGSP